jgi:hypothetical protein
MITTDLTAKNCDICIGNDGGESGDTVKVISAIRAKHGSVRRIAGFPAG